MTKKAVVLFSGGLDSTTCVAIAQSQGFAVHALSFDYGQKHVVELNAAKKVAALLRVTEHRIIPLPISILGGSALTDATMTIADFRENNSSVPNTYVPARNTIFLSIALGYAEIIGAYDIFYGANQMDYSGYCDCREDYIAAFEKLAQLATQTGVDGKSFKIHAPLLYWDKARIIQEGIKLGVNYAMTVSCYRADAEGRACGRCDSCAYRKKGFLEAQLVDSTSYV